MGAVASQPKRKRKRGDANPVVAAAAVSHSNPVAAASAASSSSSAIGMPASLTFANPVQVREPDFPEESNEFEDIELECKFEDACKLRIRNFLSLTTFPRHSCEFGFGVFHFTDPYVLF